MPKNIEDVKIIKVPLEKQPVNYQQTFPRMPRLYLELLENKTKVKQDLINVEYNPGITTQPQNQPIPPPLSPPLSPPNIDNKIKEEYHKPPVSKPDSDYSSSSDDEEIIETSSPDKKAMESRLEKLLKNESRSPSEASDASDVSIDSQGEKEIVESDSDDLSDRLKELMDDSSTAASSPEVKKSQYKSPEISRSSNKYSRHRDRHGHTIYNPSPQQSPPTLAELEKRGGFVPTHELRDVNQTYTSENNNEDLKREILFKFDLLKKSYPTASIPEFTIHTELETMQKQYDDTVRRLSLDSSVESYKNYLVYGFMGCEFVLGNFFGFDMQGFTQQQIISMNSYEKLLIELGEKSYVPSGSKWPVELRLLFMIIMNAAFFVVSRMIMKKTGANLLGMVNNMNTTSNAPQQPKRKMRGPNVDIPGF